GTSSSSFARRHRYLDSPNTLSWDSSRLMGQQWCQTPFSEEGCLEKNGVRHLICGKKVSDTFFGGRSEGPLHAEPVAAADVLAQHRRRLAAAAHLLEDPGLVEEVVELYLDLEPVARE